jgi:hypothetical protein
VASLARDSSMMASPAAAAAAIGGSRSRSDALRE